VALPHRPSPRGPLSPAAPWAPSTLICLETPIPPRALLLRSLPDFFAEVGHLDELIDLATAAGADPHKARRRMVSALVEEMDRAGLDQLCAALGADPRLSAALLTHGDPTNLPIDRNLWDLAVSLVSGPGDGRLGVADAKALFAQLDADGVYSDDEKRTVYWIRKEMTWTEAGDRTFRQLVRQAAVARRSGAEAPAAPKAAGSTAAVLEHQGVPRLVVVADEAEIARQDALAGPSFLLALEAGLRSLLHDYDDWESPLALLVNDPPDGVTFTDEHTPTDHVRECMNRGTSALTLVPLAYDAHRESGWQSAYDGPKGPEQGEHIDQNWAFHLKLDDWSVQFWAIVPRAGGWAYNYGFD